MADNLSNRGMQDRVRVNVHEKHELRYWCGASAAARASCATRFTPSA
jgi:hypothetical protein